MPTAEYTLNAPVKRVCYSFFFLFFFGFVRIRSLRPNRTISEPWDEGDGFE